MLVFGHRGAMGYAPENTLLSVQTAINLGVDWVEVDVHLVGQQLLVIHDDTLKRTTDGVGHLSDYTFAQLRRFDAGQGEYIPTLQEVIRITKNKVGLNIELKGSGVAATVIDYIATLDNKHKSKIMISSFNMKELDLIFKVNHNIKIGVLTGDNIDAAFTWARQLRAYSMHVSKQTVNKKLVERVHKAKLQLYVYTVNSEADIRRMYEMGVDGVFSDYPDRALCT